MAQMKALLNNDIGDQSINERLGIGKTLLIRQPPTR